MILYVLKTVREVAYVTNRNQTVVVTAKYTILLIYGRKR